jgi:predicted O-methyltransferase YrrM
MRDRLAVLVPTRGRPQNIAKVISAWDFTNGWDDADLILIADSDDPEIEGYRTIVEEFDRGVPDDVASPLQLVEMPVWQPMVHKLNSVAIGLALSRKYFALGFAGDDHLPRTIGWSKRYLTVLGELKTGMVYGDDGYQGSKLSTEWAVTADAVRELGRMVPADVEHMYCDNAILELFTEAGAVRHLPEVRIEHMHPHAGKASSDDQYRRVGHRDQFKKDRLGYDIWRREQMESDIDAVRSLRRGLPEVRPSTAPVRNRNPGSGPRPATARSRGVKMPRRSPFPRHFRKVQGATPEEIGVTLADFAYAVPADQEIVELGVFQGKTALQMAWGARQGHGAHVTGIDPWDLPGNVYDPPFTDKGSRLWARHHVQSLGYTDRVTLMHGFSHDVAEHWGGKQVGLLYVDGDHTKEGARRDIESWAPHLAEGARIAIDDYTHPDWPGVREAVDELVDEGFLEPIELYHDRLAVTRLAAVPATEQAGDAEAPGRVTAITSEGVSPSPGTSLTVPGQVAAEADQPVMKPDIEDYAHGGSPHEHDSEVSTEPVNEESGPPVGWVQASDGRWYDPGHVQADELEGVDAGTSIDELTLAQLKTLAKARGISLGYRKDKKADALQALREGK